MSRPIYCGELTYDSHHYDPTDANSTSDRAVRAAYYYQKCSANVLAQIWYARLIPPQVPSLVTLATRSLLKRYPRMVRQLPPHLRRDLNATIQRCMRRLYDSFLLTYDAIELEDTINRNWVKWVSIHGMIRESCRPCHKCQGWIHRHPDINDMGPRFCLVSNSLTPEISDLGRQYSCACNRWNSAGVAIAGCLCSFMVRV